MSEIPSVSQKTIHNSPFEEASADKSKESRHLDKGPMKSGSNLSARPTTEQIASESNRKKKANFDGADVGRLEKQDEVGAASGFNSKQ